MLDANDQIVKGNAQNGIAYNGEQYFAIVEGDKIGTFGDDITFAEKVFKEKTGRDL
jgi:hypothetical protein